MEKEIKKEAKFNVEDAASKVYSKAEEIYKGSEINADTLASVIDKFFANKYSERQVQTLKDYFEEQEKIFNDMYESKEIKTEAKLEESEIKNLAPEFKNYNAFRNNFGDIVIVKSTYDKQYYFFRNEQDAKTGENYFNYCDNKDYIEGWLYGAVQAENKVFGQLKKESVERTYKYDGTDKFPLKIKTRDGYVLTKVDNGIESNAYIPTYMNEAGDETLVPDVHKYEVVMEDKEIKTEERLLIPTEELPEYCYTYVASDNTIGVIKKGVVGYYPSNIEITADMTQEDIEKIVDEQNKILEITPEQKESMVLKSMFGWDDKKEEAVTPRKLSKEEYNDLILLIQEVIDFILEAKNENRQFTKEEDEEVMLCCNNIKNLAEEVGIALTKDRIFEIISSKPNVYEVVIKLGFVKGLDEEKEIQLTTTKESLQNVKEAIDDVFGDKLDTQFADAGDVVGLKMTRKSDKIELVDLVSLFDMITSALEKSGFERKDFELDLKGDSLVLAMNNIAR